MHTLSRDFDPKIFIGYYLSQIAFGVGTIHFNFGCTKIDTTNLGNASIVCESEVTYITKGHSSLIKTGDYAQISTLGALLNQDVVNASTPTSQSLRLTFSNGSIVCFEGDEHFENFQIYLPNQDVIFV